MGNLDKINSQTSAREILAWYVEMGVDETLSVHPSNWFDISKKQIARPTAVKKAPQDRSSALPTPNSSDKKAVTPSNLLPPDTAVMAARETVQSVKSLAELEEILRKFEGCGLKATAKNTCISRGHHNADLMLIGEAPGRDEDLQGKPFVGRAGQLLDKMLKAIGRDETNTYITNIVYWRPPGNRTPTPQEAQVCRPFIEKQIELVAPKIIVFLGGAAAKQMLNTNEGIMRLRGKWKDVSIHNETFQSIATLHPAYLLRTPLGKKLAWRDFLDVKHTLNS